MRALIAGSSGFLGTRLVEGLEASGHEVARLVRREPGTGEVRWDPYAGPLDPRAVDGFDVVVNLAGSPTAGNPHSKKWARELEHSRVTTTRVLADAIAAADSKPAYLAGNGISWYGDQGELRLDESADSRGDALLTRVTRSWQLATDPAADAGARVVVLRTAPVMDGRSAPMTMLKPLFKTGLAGKLGSGRQYFPMISTRDWVGAVRFLAEHDEVSGPVNLCCPETPTNAEFTKTLAEALHRPAVLPVPGAILKRAARAMAPEVLGSMRAVPQALIDAGYEFADRDVAAVVTEAIRH